MQFSKMKSSISKEWILLLLVTVATLVVGLVGIRFFAPQLLATPVDLQLVKVDKKIPPFFDNVFNEEAFKSSAFIINDPYVNRTIPLLSPPTRRLLNGIGPHDLLGFRNRAIPNVADIITIGDSQTYGNNAPLAHNWPSLLAAGLGHKTNILYNMSCGSWNGIEYLEMFKKAVYMQPRLVIVAFYSGNDPIGAFTKVYGDDHWQDLRPDPSLKPADAPKVNFPAPAAECWPVFFKDGIKTIFTPQVRDASNMDIPAVHAGYAILAEVGRRIGEIASQQRIKVIFTIIPTKELVYRAKVMQEGLTPPPAYTALVENEQRNISALAEKLRQIKGTAYVDLVQTMQKVAVSAHMLYPPNENGHPIDLGYSVIASILAPATASALPDKPQGLLRVIDDTGEYYFLLRDNRLAIFNTTDLVQKNGWDPAATPVVPYRDIEPYPITGFISSVNPQLFGPEKPTAASP
ncbi:MAG: SGNH/GDSL hydrolase family protein [Desulfobulbaceae bacterium]|nr:SGNH/GDSL hydrolase family protein [Desulfobulbaceae bacterium]